MVEPPDPLQGREHVILEAAPGHADDHFALKSPITDSAMALSYESPRLPTEGSMPASSGAANREILHGAIRLVCFVMAPTSQEKEPDNPGAVHFARSFWSTTTKRNVRASESPASAPTPAAIDNPIQSL